MLNKVCIQGRITKELDLRYTSNEKEVLNFSIANDTGFGDKKQTNFINCVAFGKTAKFISDYFIKGSAIIIVGSIRTGSYEKEGKKVYTTDVLVEEVNFSESKKTENKEPFAELQNEPNPFDELPL